MRLSPRVFLLPLLAACVWLPREIFAQGNRVENGGFEQFSTRDNLWDGVDNSSFLAGWRRSLPAVTESGDVADLPMAISVNFADVNGDGLPDLVTADPSGYFRAYINSGTKTAPKFTHSEMIPLFLSRPLQPGARAFNDEYPSVARFGTKLNLFEWSKRGVLDLVIGNYAGEIMLVPNSGNATAPDWRQPRVIDDVLVKTASAGQLWGNLFAPFAFDWNHDGKPDLLVGEGSYSANNVYVLLNKAAGGRPDFAEDSRFILAYGDGREQLAPAITDFNGDGQPDLLIGDRKGGVGVCIGAAGWKPGSVLPPPNFVPLGRGRPENNCVTPIAADWNGDGVFDIIFGRTNGRIAVAINRGTKEQPKFDQPFEVKGEDVWKQGTMSDPKGWSVDAGSEKGNLNGYFAVVDAPLDPSSAPVEGAHCLKAGYFPSLNKVFKKPLLEIPPNVDKRDLFDLTGNEIRPLRADEIARESATNNFVLHSILRTQLKTNTTYLLSFKVRGAAVREGRWILSYAGETRDKKTRDVGVESGNFAAGSQWAAVSKTIVVRFRNSALKDNPTTTAAVLELKFSLTPLEGVIYIDDVQLVEKS